MTTPAFSVLLPNRDFARYLGAAIESVLAQTLRDFEVVFVDDASTDSSRELAAEYARRDGRICCFAHDERRGIAATFNTALTAARGRYVALFASDDVWSPLKLEMQLCALEANDRDVLWSDARIIDASGAPVGLLASQVLENGPRQRSGRILNDLAHGNYISLSSVALSTAVLRRVGFEESLRYLNDFWLFLELARTQEFLFLEPVLLDYRRHANNASKFSDREGWLADVARLRQLAFPELDGELTQTAQLALRGFLDGVEKRVGEGVATAMPHSVPTKNN